MFEEPAVLATESAAPAPREEEQLEADAEPSEERECSQSVPVSDTAKNRNQCWSESLRRAESKEAP